MKLWIMTLLALVWSSMAMAESLDVIKLDITPQVATMSVQKDGRSFMSIVQICDRGMLFWAYGKDHSNKKVMVQMGDCNPEE